MGGTSSNGRTPRALDGRDAAEMAHPGLPAAGGDVPPMWAGEVALPSTGPEAATFLGVLRVRDFRLLWAAQAACQLADKFLMYTLLIVLYELTGRSSTQAAVMLAYTLPSIVLSAPAGVYADRHDKRTLMIVANAARGALVLLIPLSLSLPGLAGQAWPLIVVTALFSSVGQLFAPAEAASIPFLVQRDQIMVATSLFMTTVVGTLVAGVPLATLALRIMGRHAPFFLAAGLLGAAAVSLAAMRTSLRAGGAPHAARPDVVGELREGVRLMARDPRLRAGVLQLAVALTVVFTMFALGPAFVTVVLGRSPEDTFVLLLPSTAGLVGVAVALGRRGARTQRARAMVLALVASGVLLVASGLVPGWLIPRGHGGWLTPLALVIGAGFGASLGCLLIIAFTAVQEGTTEDVRGRIFGGVFTVVNATVALPLLLAGSIADTFGVSRAVVVLGLLLLAYAAVCRGPGWHALQRLERPRRPPVGAR